MSKKCGRYDPQCDCPACTDDRRQQYTTDMYGEKGGLPGWVRIFRNGGVVHYLPTQEQAGRWIESQIYGRAS